MSLFHIWVDSINVVLLWERRIIYNLWDEKKNINCRMSGTWRLCVQRMISGNCLAEFYIGYWKKRNGGNTPRLNSIVTVHYKGTLINGREFDNSWKRNYPEAFRLNEVIEGWQIALQRMHVGDHWIVYIPYAMGYGTRSSGPIPAFSTLVFDVQLLGIA